MSSLRGVYSWFVLTSFFSFFEMLSFVQPLSNTKIFKTTTDSIVFDTDCNYTCRNLVPYALHYAVILTTSCSVVFHVLATMLRKGNMWHVSSALYISNIVTFVQAKVDASAELCLSNSEVYFFLIERSRRAVLFCQQVGKPNGVYVHKSREKGSG